MRPLVTLAVLVFGMLGALLAGSQWGNGSLVPRLALDLEGGTEIILTPVAEDEARVTADAIEQAIQIIRQRVDASGVAEAEITSQGEGNIVVALPGTPDESTLALVRESAQMLFRPVLTIGDPVPTDLGGESFLGDDAPEPTDASDLAWLNDDVLADFAAMDCTDPVILRGGTALVGDPDAPVVACDAEGWAKYVLGPVEIRGERIDSALSTLRTTQAGVVTNEWITVINFDGEGTRLFRDVTSRLVSLEPPRNQFAMVLDGLVISAPSVNEVIPNGTAEISGSFTRESAGTLARQLNFGSLPLTFDVQSEQTISATLGSEQLEKGIIAGLIGLLLVGLYSLAQYRALGLVTIGSLAVAGLVAYLVIALLSWLQGYRLSLPGVAGLIVAIGITADSFIVFFERIRDELRDGRTLIAAVEHAWDRARRTILASDALSFVAAVVLYFLAVGGVRGFAFTLGLTTVIDLLIVFLFTYPIMRILARRRFFASGHRLSGLDPSALDARPRYAGRGRVVTGSEGSASRPDASGPEPVPVAAGGRMTIAERRAAQRRQDQARTTIEGEES